MNGYLSGEQSQKLLSQWLEQHGSIADEAFGSLFAEPAMMAIYSESAREVIEDLKAKIDKLAASSKAAIEQAGRTW